MIDSIQEEYEKKVKAYALLLHGPDKFGLIGKLQIYRSFIQKGDELGDRLGRIEPLLPYLLSSLEQDVHLTLAKFFDDSGGYGISRFLNFCRANSKHIQWKSAALLTDILDEQESLLAKHDKAIHSIMKRRNKLFAHRDKKYLNDPNKIYEDFPLSEADVVSLAQSMISIIQQHESAIPPGTISFHLGEVFELSVDNMVRNLEAGRRLNFPSQKLD